MLIKLLEFGEKDETWYEVYSDIGAYKAGEAELMIVENGVALDPIPDRVFEMVTSRIFDEAEVLREERMPSDNDEDLIKITITDMYYACETCGVTKNDDVKRNVMVVFVPVERVPEMDLHDIYADIKLRPEMY